MLTVFKDVKDWINNICREQETTKSNTASLNFKKEPSRILL